MKHRRINENKSIAFGPIWNSLVKISSKNRLDTNKKKSLLQDQRRIKRAIIYDFKLNGTFRLIILTGMASDVEYISTITFPSK